MCRYVKSEKFFLDFISHQHVKELNIKTILLHFGNSNFISHLKFFPIINKMYAVASAPRLLVSLIFRCKDITFFLNIKVKKN